MSPPEIQPGDHLWVYRLGYAHHGIASTKNCVIHYQGKKGFFEDGLIVETSLDEFSDGAEVHIKEHPDRRHSRQNSVARARRRIGETEYNLIFNNCEHFVFWCIEDEKTSKQVDAIISTGDLAATTYFLNSYRVWSIAQTGDRMYQAASLISSLGKGAIAAAGTAGTASNTAAIAGLASGASAGGVATSLIGTTGATALGAVGSVAAAPLVIGCAAAITVGGLVYAGWKRFFDD